MNRYYDTEKLFQIIKEPRKIKIVPLIIKLLKDGTENYTIVKKDLVDQIRKYIEYLEDKTEDNIRRAYIEGLTERLDEIKQLKAENIHLKKEIAKLKNE